MASLDLTPLASRTGTGTSAWSRVARELLGSLARLTGAGIVVALSIAGGLWSSRTLIDRGSLISTDSYGPWQHWSQTGRATADPYTRAHLAGSGTIRISSDSAGIYEARADALGARLHSSCDYVIEGPGMGGQWWSLAVFDARGKLIANDAARYAFTSDTVAVNPDGSYIVTLGRDARPGNWLPTGGAGRLVLVFSVLDPATGLSDDARIERAKALPVIRREGCS